MNDRDTLALLTLRRSKKEKKEMKMCNSLFDPKYNKHKQIISLAHHVSCFYHSLSFCISYSAKWGHVIHVTQSPQCRITQGNSSPWKVPTPGGKSHTRQQERASGNEKNANLVVEILHLASLMRDQGDQGRGQLWLWKVKEYTFLCKEEKKGRGQGAAAERGMVGWGNVKHRAS